MFRFIGVLLAGVLYLVGCRRPASPIPGRNLHLVAHPDDDLLFMNPQLGEEILGGQVVHTVYLTAGDAGESSAYWEQRELGVRAAYAAMAGLPNAWTLSPLQVAGRELRSYTLDGATRVRLTFLRLPDGGSGGAGFHSQHHQSLGRLWGGQIGSLLAVDGSARHSRARMVELIQGLLRQERPSAVHLLNPLPRWDHSDHAVSARVGLLALATSGLRAQLQLSRGYDTASDHPNLSSDQAQAKWETFLVYAPFDRHVCPPGSRCLERSNYRKWCSREYESQPTEDLLAGL
jgi:LmbE family N-acetylglucosaminyl deacetylase